MWENAKCSVQQILAEKRHFDCIFCMFSIFRLHFFMSLIIPVLAQQKPNRTFIYRYCPSSAKERIRRPVQSQSYFPVKGWTCSWHDLIIPRWLKQMSRPSRSPCTYSRRNREICFSGTIRNCIQRWLLEPKDMLMWTWRIPVYFKYILWLQNNFSMWKETKQNKNLHQYDSLFCYLITSCTFRMDLLSSKFLSENTHVPSSSLHILYQRYLALQLISILP